MEPKSILLSTLSQWQVIATGIGSSCLILLGYLNYRFNKKIELLKFEHQKTKEKYQQLEIIRKELNEAFSLIYNQGDLKDSNYNKITCISKDSYADGLCRWFYINCTRLDHLTNAAVQSRLYMSDETSIVIFNLIAQVAEENLEIEKIFLPFIIAGDGSGLTKSLMMNQGRIQKLSELCREISHKINTAVLTATHRTYSPDVMSVFKDI